MAAILVLGVAALEAYRYVRSLGPILGWPLYGFTSDQLAVTFIAEDLRLTAYRWTTEEPFTILVVTPGTAEIERCVAGEGFARWLGVLSDIRNGGKLNDLRDFSSPGWGSLTIGDEGWGGIQFLVHIPRTGDGPVIVESDVEYYAVDYADSAVWSLIWSGCAGLSTQP
jgi:hypothetical protein